MPITRKDVEYVARLARLRLTGEEQERLSSQLGAIVGYVEKLGELDTKAVEPTAHVLPLENVTRPDATATTLDRDAVLRLAPKSEDGFVKVPRVIE